MPLPDVPATSTVALEPLRPAHAVEMFAGLADAAGYVFLPEDPPESPEALRTRYEQLCAGVSPDGEEVWRNWVVRSCDAGTLVGYTQATIRDRRALLGYHIFPCRWRQGLGTAAVRLTVVTLLERFRVEEIHALVDTRNAASSSLLRRLGFRLSRTIIGADHFKGGWSDEHEFVLRPGTGRTSSPTGPGGDADHRQAPTDPPPADPPLADPPPAGSR